MVNIFCIPYKFMRIWKLYYFEYRTSYIVWNTTSYSSNYPARIIKNPWVTVKWFALEVQVSCNYGTISCPSLVTRALVSASLSQPYILLVLGLTTHQNTALTVTHDFSHLELYKTCTPKLYDNTYYGLDLLCLRCKVRYPSFVSCHIWFINIALPLISYLEKFMQQPYIFAGWLKDNSASFHDNIEIDNHYSLQ